MLYDSLLFLSTIEDYRLHFHKEYCKGPVQTFDGISVRFRKTVFDHAFFESTKRNQIKDQFSKERASRMGWIKRVLNDSTAELYVGWNKKNKSYDDKSRVALVVGGYVVIIRFINEINAEFVTAYVANSKPSGIQRISSLAAIRKSPVWEKKNR